MNYLRDCKMDSSKTIKHRYKEEVLRVFPNALTTDIKLVIRALKEHFGINVTKKCIIKNGIRNYYFTSEIGFDSKSTRDCYQGLTDVRRAYVTSILEKCKTSNGKPNQVSIWR